MSPVFEEQLVFVLVCVFIYVHAYICMYVCVYMCVCVCLCIHTYIHILSDGFCFKMFLIVYLAFDTFVLLLMNCDNLFP